MEEKDLLSRIENLEKRVTSLEKELSVIAHINQSEKVKEYIASAEKSKKIAMLLDMGSKKEGVLENTVEQAIDESITSTLSNISSVNGLATAKEYVAQVEECITQEIDQHKNLVNQYDWESLFGYSIDGGSVKIDSYMGFDDIKTVIIPEKIDGYTVTEIGDSVFKNCKNIIEIILPDTIVNIGREAFADSGLIKINLMEGIKNIGERAFHGTPIIDIHIPASLVGISSGVFGACNLEKIYFREGITFIGERAFWYCKKLSKIDIPSSVRKIGREVFGDIISTTIRYGVGSVAVNSLNIRIPDSVEEIFGMNNAESWPQHSIFGYMNNKDIYTGICIYCNPGSNAMKFAREYGIQVKRYEEFDLLEE